MSSGEPGAWRWVQASVVFAIHDRQLAEHGGMDGIRERGAIESALARPFEPGRLRHARCGRIGEAALADWLRLHIKM